MEFLRKELYTLKFRKMHTKYEKNIKTLFCHFLSIKMETNDYITLILVYCTMLVLFQIIYMEGPESATIK